MRRSISSSCRYCFLHRRQPPVISSVSKRTRRRDAFRGAASERSGGWRWPRPGGGRYSRKISSRGGRCKRVSFTVHPLGRSEPSDPFPVVRINQGETPTVEGLAWTPPSQVRSAPSRRPAALLAPPPPFGDLSGGPAPAAAGCSCSLLLPLPKNVSWSFI